MQEKLKEYIDGLFASVPDSENAFSAKAEALGRLTLIYDSYIKQGKSENEAYALAISSLGNMGDILSRAQNGNENIADIQKNRRLASLLTAVAVAMYILCPVPVLTLQDNIGVVLLLVIVAVATGLIVFAAMTRKKAGKAEIVLSDEPQSKAFKAVSSALWSVTVAIYLVVSFFTHAWHITWIIFLIAAAVEGIIKAVFDLKESAQ